MDTQPQTEVSLDLFGFSPKIKPAKKVKVTDNQSSFERAFNARRANRLLKFAQNSAFDTPEALLYMSGCSSISDIKGYIKSNADICVTYKDLSKNGVKELINYLQKAKGGKVFIDSGAFRVLDKKTGKNKEEINFSDVLSFYREMALCTPFTNKLTVCAPDVIGNQKASLELQLKHKVEIQWIIKTGVEVMFPLQKGENPLGTVFTELCKTFGKENVIVGLPSNAKAIPHKELLNFLKEHKPVRAHILGANKNKAIVNSAIHISPTTTITCDSNRTQAYVGTGAPLTDLCKHNTEKALNWYSEITNNTDGLANISLRPNWLPDKYMYFTDYTDFDESHAILELSTEGKFALCKTLHIYMPELMLTPKKLIQIANENSSFYQYLSDTYNKEWAISICDLIWGFYLKILADKLTHKHASPMSRTHSIYMCHKEGLFD